MKRISFFCLFLLMGMENLWADDLWADESLLTGTSDSLVQDTAKEALPESGTVLSESPEKTAVTKSPARADSVPVDFVKKDVWADSVKTAPVPADSQKPAGLLSSLRPVESNEAIYRGNFMGGATLFLLQGNTDKETLNILIGDLYEADGYTFTVEGFGGYFIRDAMALGIRAGYSRTKLDIDYSILDDIADIAEHRKYLSNGFFVKPFLKNYLKVFDSKTLYFFNETSLSVEYSYGISQTDDGDDLSKTRNRDWTFELGINPGLSIMVLDKLAFETSVGLLGLSSTVMEIEENGEKRSEFTYNIVNFTINLLALDFSLVYFF